MNHSVHTVCSLLLGVLLGGCVLAPPATPPPVSAPLFQLASEDAKELALLASELETQAMECRANASCDDRMHFTRALLNLFEHRDAARDAFEQVLTRTPSSPFAASSALWLELLKQDDDDITALSEDPQQRLLIDLTAQSIRELVDRHSSGRVREPNTAARSKATTVQTLYKQVEDRDRRIAKLRAQLDALKVIDLDQQARQRKIRAPRSVSRDEAR
jgi:hypothetical protein